MESSFSTFGRRIDLPMDKAILVINTSFSSSVVVVSTSLEYRTKSETGIVKKFIDIRLNVLEECIQHKQVNLRQPQKRNLQILNVLLFVRDFYSTRANGGVDTANVVPAFVSAQRRIELECPEFDGAREDRSIILGQQFFRNRLSSRDAIDTLAEMVHGSQRYLINPSLSLL